MSIDKIIETIFEYGTSLSSVLLIIGITSIIFSFILYLATIGVMIVKVENLNKPKVYRLSIVLFIIAIISILASIFSNYLADQVKPQGEGEIKISTDCSVKDDVKLALDLVKNTLATRKSISNSSIVILESYENQFTKYLDEDSLCKDYKKIENVIKEVDYIENYIERL